MRNTITLDINAPQAQVAALMADLQLLPQWMDDLDHIEPAGPGYRLVPKKGSMVFVATVIARELPNRLQLSMKAGNISVLVTDTFERLSDDKTRLISEEIFTFEGVIHKLLGLVSGRAIRNAHRRHMDAFQRFAERRSQP